MPPGSLEVTVLQAEGLHDVETFGRQDPYCVVVCGAQKFRTKTATDGGTNPRFNERLTMNIGNEQELNVQIMDSNTLMSDSLIGSCKVPLARAFQIGYDDTPAAVLNPKGKPRGTLRVLVQYRGAGGAAPGAYPPQQQQGGYAAPAAAGAFGPPAMAHRAMARLRQAATARLRLRPTARCLAPRGTRRSSRTPYRRSRTGSPEGTPLRTPACNRRSVPRRKRSPRRRSHTSTSGGPPPPRPPAPKHTATARRVGASSSSR